MPDFSKLNKALRYGLVFFLVIEVFPGLYSCNSVEENNKPNYAFSNLRIVIDTNANFYIDSIGLSAMRKVKLPYSQMYDSTYNSLVYMFDSVLNGDVDITLVSILNRNYKKNITLKSDTTIFISRDELHNFKNEKPKSLTIESMKEKDTIVIGLNSLGCFHSLQENIIISKQQNKFVVELNTTRGSNIGYDPIHIKKEFDLSFGEKIDSFYNDCRKLLFGKSWCMSTTSTYISIRKGNSVYDMPDIGCGDWKGYYSLFKAINPPLLTEKRIGILSIYATLAEY